MKALKILFVISACLLLTSCSMWHSSEPSEADIAYTIRYHNKDIGKFTLLRVQYDDGKTGRENVRNFQLLTADGGMKSIGLRREGDDKWCLIGNGIHWEVLHAEAQ